jgi:hypothetical protein
MVSAVLHFGLQQRAIFSLVVMESTDAWWPVARAHCVRYFRLADVGAPAIEVYGGRSRPLVFPLRRPLWVFRFEF